MAACRDEHADLGRLAELVTHDQSLATHVLRVANSVGFGARVPVHSLRHAIGRLGLSTLSDVAIAVALKQRVFEVRGHEERIRELWLHSVTAACYARDVATLLAQDHESAFLCGLLHDVGMPIVLQATCDLAREQRKEPVARAVLEAAMAAFHRELGARMAQRWRLGPRVAPRSAPSRPDGCGPGERLARSPRWSAQLAHRAPDDLRRERLHAGADVALDPSCFPWSTSRHPGARGGSPRAGAGVPVAWAP
jgi:putative nucleotidyltransferase with HDIG domain